uniref:TRAP transporter small permease protein n=1 Tax=Candidatus Kentrum sp. FM TaxID=2126340 RepID=A0A450VV68_9GAMM|nr:MAG: TRAP-type mannitol/chloroaromatic compound transport system, small permease component [Candidatus Kentron sp. FM]VFJ50032.1 MAG: TRAP-type mannitol/chloroaromatic compound transport system, small permease component [Candidatus Kentron sp. FM]VFK08711.1 MAG: TRAP-type mannitol/chloroaromatic compound transport system, small permease component [Candidatus Kentron sp. FM]
MLRKLQKLSDRFTDVLGYTAGVLVLLTLLNVFYDAMMRYFFHTGSIALQEMEWHMFSLLFLFGISYTLKEDGHVRVDLVYSRLGPRAKASINLLGTLFFLIPLSVLIIQGSLSFVEEAYELGEISGDPGGLTHRWLIKAMIPISFLFLLCTMVGFVIRNWRIYRGMDVPPDFGSKQIL